MPPTGPEIARRLWLRSLDSVDAIADRRHRGGIFPFWSPDGRSIAFATGGALKRKDLAGGPSRTLVENVVVRGGTWNRDGVILYAAAAAQGIFRVSADGGTPTAVTNPDVARGESHTFPQFLPDGQHFLYLARSQVTADRVRRLARWALRSTCSIRTHACRYAEPGFLFVHRRRGALLARRFDASRLEITGEAIPARPPGRHLQRPRCVVCRRRHRTLVYAEANAGTSQLTWFDRSGQTIGTVGSAAQHMGVRLSPDGTRAAVMQADPSVNTPDLWLIEFGRGAESRFTFRPQIDLSPVWSPDGSARGVLVEGRYGDFQVFERATAEAPTRPLVVSDDSDAFPGGLESGWPIPPVCSTNPPAATTI